MRFRSRGMGSTKKALHRVTDAIAQLSRLPHVICLQEVETRSLRSKLSHTKGDSEETQVQAPDEVFGQSAR